jgi:hypothetical protein
MNSNTHKVITATYYPREVLYAVPIDWDVNDVKIRYREVYYKGELQYPPEFEVEYDDKIPNKITEEDYELEQFFDCEDEDE